MPTTNEIDPRQKRERMPFETDDQYTERIKRLDSVRAMLDSIPIRPTQDNDIYL